MEEAAPETRRVLTGEKEFQGPVWCQGVKHREARRGGAQRGGGKS